MDVEIRQIEELRVATVRHLGPYEGIGEACGRLAVAVNETGLRAQPEVGLLVALYHDDPRNTAPEQLRSDAGRMVGASVELPTQVMEEFIPAGTYACVTHVGSYAGLPGVWGRLLGDWLPSLGWKAAPGVMCEVYLNEPPQVPDAELRTELRVPVESLSG